MPYPLYVQTSDGIEKLVEIGGCTGVASIYDEMECRFFQLCGCESDDELLSWALSHMECGNDVEWAFVWDKTTGEILASHRREYR